MYLRVFMHVRAFMHERANADRRTFRFPGWQPWRPEVVCALCDERELRIEVLRADKSDLQNS